MEEQFARIDDRFDRMEERFNGLEERFNGLGWRFDGANDRIKATTSDLRATFEHELRSQTTTMVFGLVTVVLTMAALAFALVRFA